MEAVAVIQNEVKRSRRHLAASTLDFLAKHQVSAEQNGRPDMTKVSATQKEAPERIWIPNEAARGRDG